MQSCPSCGELVPIEYVVCVWCGYDLTAEHIRRSGITIGRREAIERGKKVVVDPLTAFKEIALIPDNTGGKLIFYLIGLAMTFNMLTIFSKLDGLDFNKELSSIVITQNISIPIKLILNLLFIILEPLLLYLIFLVIWKLASRIMSLLARSVGGKGDKEKIRAVIGYSMLPVLFAWTLSWLVRLLTPSVTVESTGEGITYNTVEDALISVSESGFGIVSVGLMWIGWIWATILGIIGMRHAARLSWVEAILVAGIPYIIFMTIAI